MWFLLAFVLTIALMPKQEFLDAKPVGLDDFNFPTASASKCVPYCIGKFKLEGANVLDYWGMYTKPITQKMSGGMFSGSKKVTVGFKYYLKGLVLGLGWTTGGYTLKRIGFGDFVAWEGTQSSTGSFTITNKDGLFGDPKEQGGVGGDVLFYAGDNPQTASSWWQTNWSQAPAFHNLAYIIFKNFYVGNSSSMRRIWVEGTNYPNPFNHATNHKIGDDANAAYALWEVWTNQKLGAGIQPTELDQSSFETVAARLATDGVGVTMKFQSTTDIETIEKELLKHMNASFYNDKTTGKRTLYLINDDYLSESPPGSSLPTLTEDNIQEGGLKNFKRGSLSTAVTEVRVKYIDRAGEYQERIAHSQNTGAALDLGRDVSVTLDYTGFTTIENAGKIADREMKALSITPATFTVVTDRSTWDWFVGKPFILSYSPLNIASMYCRVQDIDFGELTDNKITMRCIEDAFAFGTAVYDDDDAASSITIVNDPIDVPTANINVHELPRWLIDDAGVAEHRLMTLVARPTVDAVDYGVLHNQEGYYEEAGEDFGFADIYLIVTTINQFDTSIDVYDYTTGSALAPTELVNRTTSELRDGYNYFLFTDTTTGKHEIVGFTTVTIDSPPTKATLTGVKRGCFDTTPQDLTALTVGVLLEHAGIVIGQFTASESVSLKFLPHTLNGTLDEASATAYPVTLDNRAERPLAPGRVQINSSGDSAPADLLPLDDVVIAWEHRDKDGAQLPWTIDTGITSEAGVTYHLRFLNGSVSPNTVLRTVDNGATTTYSYTKDNKLSDNGGEAFETLIVEVWSERDSPAVESFQRQIRTLTHEFWYTDKFNRADESPIAGDWATTLVGSLDLSSNELITGSGTSGAQTIEAVSGAVSGDQYAQMKITELGGSATWGFGLVCRGKSASPWEGYFCTVRSDGALRLWWWKPGTGSAVYVTTAASTVAVNDIVRFEVTGTGGSINLEAFVNGSSVASASGVANQIDAGYPGAGYLGSSTTGKGDDFEAGAL